MGATAIYRLPWPELPDVADGPDGYQDLAKATESALTKVKSSITPVGSWGDVPLQVPTNLPLNGTDWITNLVTMTVKPYARVIDILASVHTTVGAVSVNLYINNGAVRISEKNEVGTCNLTHRVGLAANGHMTLQVQVTAQVANTHWSNDPRFTRVSWSAQPI